MLVLSRKPGERLKIGEVIVTIVRMGGGAVRVGIDAPREMQINRLDAIQMENVIIDGAVVRRPVETPEEREHRLAMAELRSKPPGNIRHAK